MRKKGYKGRCEKKDLAKSREVCRTYAAIQSTYADILQNDKGNEEYQKYMEDLTDMQNHVLPYLQSFCSLEEKGVKERREQQVAEKNESREAVPRAGVEANTAVKDAGKAERKAVAQKKTMTGKEKKPSIHERLEINKRIIQEKQGKDKPERGADMGVRTV